MTSAEINDAIRELDNRDIPVYEGGIGGKVVPYIGWYWRTVDFDRFPYPFGVLPNSEEGKGGIGFMVNNKWDYGYVFAPKEQCVEIRSAIEAAISSENPEDFCRVDTLIQALGGAK